MSREHVPLKEQLAAALGQLFQIPHEHRQLMTADQVIGLFQKDHIIAKAHDGPDLHWNLDWQWKAEHRHKTAKIDQPRIAKSVRIGKAEEEFRARMLKPSSERKSEPSKWPKGRKLQSRNTLRRARDHER